MFLGKGDKNVICGVMRGCALRTYQEEYTERWICP